MAADTAKTLIAKGILQIEVGPAPISFDDIWEQSSDAVRETALRKAQRALEVLEMRGYSIQAK